MQQGVAIAGNILVDYLKCIQTYPRCGMLASITNLEQSVGGCVPNTLLNLHRIDPSIPVLPYGCVGDDENGRYVIDYLQREGVDTSTVCRLPDCATSFSDAYYALDTKERTFFHYRGANACFGPEHVKPDAQTISLLHIGYLLLLDKFDRRDTEYGTVMAHFLCDMQRQGIETSIDVVSNSSGTYIQTIKPALKYCDYVIINELEGCQAFGLTARAADGTLNRKNVVLALEKMMEAGVSKRAVLHCPEAGFCMEGNGRLTVVPSFLLSQDYVKGSVGAGDAFCAGCLYAIHCGMDAVSMLRFGAAAAAANLSAVDAVSGMKSADELAVMINTWEIRENETI